MNKSELVERLAERAKITKKRAEQVVNLVFDQMTQALKRGERIEIRGFGSFTSKSYDAYTGRNPRTGETIHVPAKRLPFFKVGKELKERVDYPPNARGGNNVARYDDDDDDDESENLDRMTAQNGAENGHADFESDEDTDEFGDDEDQGGIATA
jgi:integration host factor subunit beta